MLKEGNYGKKRRKFTAEFKAKALELAETMGSFEGAAEALGISPQSPYGWKQSAARKAMKHPDPALVAELKNEIKQLWKELKEQHQAVQVLKHATVFLPGQKYEPFMIAAQLKEKDIAPGIACDALGVSRGGFYKWQKHIEAKRTVENNLLKGKVIEISRESRGT